MHFDFFLEDKAKKFLESKGNILSISRMDIQSGCMSMEDVDISYKKPTQSNYDQYVYEGVTIYVQYGLQFQDHLIKIVVSGVGPFKTIAVGNLDRGII